jgi:hypothetical protein
MAWRYRNSRKWLFPSLLAMLSVAPEVAHQLVKIVPNDANYSKGS